MAVPSRIEVADRVVRQGVSRARRRGRPKKHYGSKSRRGTEVAALFYTLFETANRSGIDPRAYVTLAAKRAIADHSAVTLPSDLT
jgi:hypothetical protein